MALTFLILVIFGLIGYCAMLDISTPPDFDIKPIDIPKEY